MTLLKEAASNFLSCPMMKPGFGENIINRDRNNVFGRVGAAQRQPAREPARAQPLRAPTADELDMIMPMGFDVELASSALQMANFEIPRALELLLSGQEAEIINFATRQRELKEQEEQEQLKREMELAMKLSM